MRNVFLAGLITLAATLPAVAALPPQYQRQAELQAIIGDERVIEAFGIEGIEAIELVGADHYQVRGGGCSLDITIEDAPATHAEGWVGPREFQLALGDKAC